MGKNKNNKSIGGYIAIGLAVILISFFIPAPKKEFKTIVVQYDPRSLDSVVYQVKKGSINRIGECISFTTTGQKSINLCKNYDEKLVEK